MRCPPDRGRAGRPGIWALTLLLLWQGVAPARAAEASPRLLWPEGRSWLAPDGELVLQLSPALAAVAARLRLELDAIDVSELARVEDNVLRFAPPQALDYGDHKLRLVEFRDDGEIVEQGVWRFEVRQSAAFRESRLAPAVEVVWQTLASRRNLPPGTDANVTQVAADLSASLANPGYRLETRNSLVRDSALDADRTQLYELLFAAENDHARLALGQQDIGAQSLIMQDFNRRGLSARLDAGHARLTGFALRTDTLTALDDGFGLNDSDKLTRGVQARFSPLPDRRLVLAAGFLRGRGSDEGVAELGDGQGGASAPEGDAWTLSADSDFFDERLRLYGEYARSDYDFDGAGNGFAARDDDAFRVALQYRAPNDGELAWTAGLQWQQVGSFFRSVANPSLPNDKRLLNATLAVTRGGLSGNLLLGLERDNLDKRADFPTIQSRVIQLSLGYSAWADEERDSGALARLFASPAWQLDLARIANRQTDDPALYLGDKTDNRSLDLALSLGFTPGAWNWSLGYQANRFDDAAGVQSDTRSDLFSLDASVPLGDWLSVTPAVQVGRAEDRDSGVRQDDLSATLGLALGLERLSGSLDYSFSRSTSSDDSVESRDQVLSLAFAFNLWPARTTRPGLDLFMNATWSDSDAGPDAAGIPLSRQVFLGLRTRWAPES